MINGVLKGKKVRFNDSTTGKIKEVWEKVYYAAQIVLEDVELAGTSAIKFRQDSNWIMHQMSRVARTFLEISLSKRDGTAARNVLELYMG